MDLRTTVRALAARLPASAGGLLEPLASGGVPLLVARLPGPFRAAFTTRRGGVSDGSHMSLNLGVAGADDPERVRQNRVRLRTALAALGASPGQPHGPPLQLLSPLQIHGTRVVGASEYAASTPAGLEGIPLAATEGWSDPGAGCDGLVLRPSLDEGLAATLLFADCVPVVLVGEVDMAVAHGGWRGLLGGVVQQAARAMTGPPGLAFVGPSIGPCCYRVSDELAAAFAERYGEGVAQPGPRLDLWEVATRALAEVEVPRHRVVNPRLCTACAPDLFYSFRRDGAQTGRQAAVIWLEGGRQET